MVNEKINLSMLLGTISFVFVIIGLICSILSILYVSKLNKSELTMSVVVLTFICFLILFGLSLGMYFISG